MAKQTTFGELKIGDRFTWRGTEYVKVEYAWLGRYGHVNAQGPGFYEGDTGHRHFTDDQAVTIEE